MSGTRSHAEDESALLATLLVPLGAAGVAHAPHRVQARARSATGRRSRGPNRDGISDETGLIDKWALNGAELPLARARTAAARRRSSWATASTCRTRPAAAPTLQERVMALDADTGKVVWEYKFNIFQSDVPPHRVGWASPAADPETGNIYALSVGAQVDRAEQGRQAAVGPLDRRRVRRVHHARRPDDVAARRRRPGHRQRGDLELGHAAQPRAPLRRARQADRRHRLRVASPGGRPYDTAYAAPIIATINGMRLLIAGTRRRRRSTRSSRRPARRSGATSPPSAPSTPASSSAATP